MQVWPGLPVVHVLLQSTDNRPSAYFLPALSALHTVSAKPFETYAAVALLPFPLQVRAARMAFVISTLIVSLAACALYCLRIGLSLTQYLPGTVRFGLNHALALLLHQLMSSPDNRAA